MKKFLFLAFILLLGIQISAQENEYGEWVLADTMNHVTYGASTLLNSGKVLVVGNNSACELYDYATDRWEDTDSTRSTRSGHVLITLLDGRALLMGGSVNEIYNEDEGKWEISASFNIPKIEGKAILLKDGKVLYISGRMLDGRVTPSCELYDPTTNVWEVVDTLTTGRIMHGVNLLHDGRVLVTGGDSYSGYLNKCEIFDPVTKEWTETTPMNYKHVNHPSHTLADGKVIVTGGDYENTKTCEVFDPVNNEWIQVSDVFPPCNLVRGGSFILDKTKLLVVDAGVWGIYDTESFVSLGYYYTKNYNLFNAMYELLPDNSLISMGGTIFKQSGAIGPSKLCEIFKPTTTNIENQDKEKISFELFNNYPNPFNPTTTIKFSLSNESRISLLIYNLLGQRIVSLIENEIKKSGNYKIVYDSKSLPSGVYYYRLITPHNSLTKKMIKLN